MVTLCGTLSAAVAQTSPLSVQSSNLTVLISKIIVNQNNVSIQFVAKNDTKGRVYLRDALLDQSQYAFLGSGAQLNYPQSVVGINYCEGSVNQCNNSEDAANLNDYSYIDPGEDTGFMIVYRAPNPISTGDTISFCLVLVAKFASPTGDPTQPGGPQGVRFNFPFTPLN
jgi:hypothetical protein